MKRHGRLASLAALGLVLALEGRARAEADTFGLGTGHDGPLNVTSTTGQVINTYAPVTAAVAAGTTMMLVGTRAGAASSFTAGQLVMIFQTRGGFTTPPTSGSAAAIALPATSKTGRYELARIASASGDMVVLTHPTSNAYDPADTQLVSVPEYTTVTVNANAKLSAMPWTGVSGGVLAFLATGVVSNTGTLTASTAGFDGGVRIQSASPKGCAADDGAPVLGGAEAGGAHKGEGLDPTAFDMATAYAGGVPRRFGRGNVANGGGGGDCFNAGGGGGGHAAAGGVGGNTNPNAEASRAVGGRGGAPVTYDPLATLVLGGGGGAGDDDDGVGGRGGAGGGVIWLRADSLTGVGTLDADGEAGANAAGALNPIFSDGGGGGGAGGGVFASLKGDATCGGIRARGGKGGNAIPSVVGRDYGPGGGGAGGRVQVKASGGACSAIVTPGLSGVTSMAAAFGATAGGVGMSATAAALTDTTCDVTSGKCGGCVSDAYCPATAPTCITAAGPAQYTCTGGSSSGDGGADGGGDGGSSGSNGSSSTSSGGDTPPSNAGVSLEGGGVSCNAAPASTSSAFTLAGLSAVVALLIRRKRRGQ